MTGLACGLVGHPPCLPAVRLALRSTPSPLQSHVTFEVTRTAEGGPTWQVRHGCLPSHASGWQEFYLDVNRQRLFGYGEAVRVLGERAVSPVPV